MFTFGNSMVSVAGGGRVVLNGVEFTAGGVSQRRKSVDQSGDGKTLSGNYSTFRGNNNKIKCSYSKIFGDGNVITGNYNEITGHNNTISGSYNDPITGNFNVVSKGNYNKFIGDECKVTGSYNEFTGDRCQASGNYNEAQGTGCVLTGSYCKINGDDVESERKSSSRGGIRFGNGSVSIGDMTVDGNMSVIATDAGTWINGVRLEDLQNRAPVAVAAPVEVKAPALVRAKISEDVKDTETEDDKKQCKICMTNEIRTVIKDCGHMCLCFTCARTELDKCPICRAEIKEGIMPVFAA